MCRLHPLHTEDLSVEQGVRLFREEAFMEESSARREAERGTFDPMYLVYSIGKLMLLKLRQDSKQQLGKAFSLRTFHDTLLGQGTAPIWLHRKLLLGDADAGDLLNEPRAQLQLSRGRISTPMPLYEYECDACGHRFEVIQKFSDAPVEKCPSCGGHVHKMQSAPAIQFKGTGWYITDYAKKDTGGGKADGTRSGKKDGSAPSSGGDSGGSSDSSQKGRPIPDRRRLLSRPGRLGRAGRLDRAAGLPRRPEAGGARTVAPSFARRRAGPQSFAISASMSSESRYARNLIATSGGECEIDHRLQEAELVAVSCRTPLTSHA